MNTNDRNTAPADAQELAQQQEREQRAIQTATTILRQIKADTAHLCDSWAMARPTATHYNDAPALCFEVNALQHRGRVVVSLDEGRDLYDIRTLSDTGETLAERLGIFCDDLAAVIDELVERPATMTDAQYIAALKAQGDPVLNWLLSKRERGERAQIITF